MARPYTPTERAAVRLHRALDCDSSFAADICVQHAAMTLRKAGYHALADIVTAAHHSEWPALVEALSGSRRGA